MLYHVENEITEISRSFSTLTLYTQKLKVANAHFKNFFSVKYQILNLEVRIFLHFVVD
jgi:hypothetical protein